MDDCPLPVSEGGIGEICIVACGNIIKRGLLRRIGMLLFGHTVTGQPKIGEFIIPVV
jgi:hypothetical protein